MIRSRALIEDRIANLESVVSTMQAERLGDSDIAKSFFMDENRSVSIINGDASDLATAIALLNQVRTILIRNGFAI
jgi:hypothetical protein